MKLFDPITIRGTGFKNRIVMPPMQIGVGMRSTRARAYYLERARGGAGTIIMAAASVDLFTDDNAWGRPGAVQAFLSGMTPFIAEVHQTGARIGIQIWHGNQLPAGTGAPSDTRGESVAPSATGPARELTVAEIGTIISRFAGAAAAARGAGFDFIEVHGAHGYLVCQFFSPLTNWRRDGYGGSLAGRMRFSTECVAAVRAAVGKDYPIFYRFPAWEDTPGGITLADSVPFAVALEKAGVDAFDVSLGNAVGPAFQITPGAEQKEGTFVHLASAIKAAVKATVIGVGRFRTPQVAEAALARGEIDMVAIGRQLIADPQWPNRVLAGKTEDIIPCISCNACLETGLLGSGLQCSVNADTGAEAGAELKPAPVPRRVMVIGGGPAGMEAARVAALRGHRVTLYEKQGQPGGQLVPAAVPPFKSELAALNRYLVRQLGKAGVATRTGAEVTPELVAKEHPDVVVMATGSLPMMPDIPGPKTRVVTAVDVLLGKAEVGDRVVVVGGELVGCETADFLAQRGKKVTVVRRGPEMAAKMFSRNREALLERLKTGGVELLAGVRKYEALVPGGMVIINAAGERRTLKADTIVMAAGALPANALAGALREKGIEVHLAGDCSQPKRVLDAIHDGARVGRAV